MHSIWTNGNAINFGFTFQNHDRISVNCANMHYTLHTAHYSMHKWIGVWNSEIRANRKTNTKVCMCVCWNGEMKNKENQITGTIIPSTGRGAKLLAHKRAMIRFLFNFETAFANTLAHTWTTAPNGTTTTGEAKENKRNKLYLFERSANLFIKIGIENLQRKWL